MDAVPPSIPRHNRHPRRRDFEGSSTDAGEREFTNLISCLFRTCIPDVASSSKALHCWKLSRGRHARHTDT